MIAIRWSCDQILQSDLVEKEKFIKIQILKIEVWNSVYK